MWDCRTSSSCGIVSTHCRRRCPSLTTRGVRNRYTCFGRALRCALKRVSAEFAGVAVVVEERNRTFSTGGGSVTNAPTKYFANS